MITIWPKIGSKIVATDELLANSVMNDAKSEIKIRVTVIGSWLSCDNWMPRCLANPDL